MSNKKIKARTNAGRVGLFIIGLVVGWVFYLFIFAMSLGGNEGQKLPNKCGIISLILSLLTMTIYIVISEYNYIKRLQLTTNSLYSNITLYKDRENKLLSKSEKIISQFLHHESDVQKSVASFRSGNGVKHDYGEKIMSLEDLKVTVENYPDLKSDKHISAILNKLEEAQNSILNSKLLYNDYVAYYNSAIVGFPTVMFSGLWMLKPMQFYEDNNYDEL